MPLQSRKANIFPFFFIIDLLTNPYMHIMYQYVLSWVGSWQVMYWYSQDRKCGHNLLPVITPTVAANEMETQKKWKLCSVSIFIASFTVLAFVIMCLAVLYDG